MNEPHRISDQSWRETLMERDQLIAALRQHLAEARRERDALHREWKGTEGALTDANVMPVESHAKGVRRLMRERDEARALLREIQWDRDVDGTYGCPVCFCPETEGHAPDCRLDAALEGR